MLKSESWRRVPVIGVFLLSMAALAACGEEEGEVGDTGEATTEQPAANGEPMTAPDTTAPETTAPEATTPEPAAPAD